ncbi:glycosyltransferase [Candidatus Methylospira mobilis]|uniref:Glycosyltransferase n=1 Tax=Candidatus Methylospira mobilis TaxID=1808979 RepID=A0A5Q0BIK7_9GAMM|nr:glycosyltransferase family 2 protein [Candidatus Methylospira mobilis]QFY41997.1 glycosyltransferase [Candidatus Methylospira mobilis]WNV02989.1 glycosyltransferase family 2 protein [Candidatus Methylospira mobilis]
MSIAVIVTTYQRPLALNCVLSSLAAQTRLPDEVIIADDGSGAETADLISIWQKKFPCPLQHVWQKNLGFRAARSRNRAVVASRSDYLIFLDGDCLVFPDFVAKHRALAETKHIVMGSRILCSQELTRRIEQQQEQPAHWGPFFWLQARLCKHVNRLLPLLMLPGHKWRKQKNKHWKGIRTFNLAVWRSDFFRVNGFDETFQGWGHEDADLAVRLLHSGVSRKHGQFALPVLHLWHTESDRSREAINRANLEQRLAKAQIRAQNGIDQYAAPHGAEAITEYAS